jgi:anti-sigma B factor antagonist
MSTETAATDARRVGEIGIIDIRGDITADTEDVLMEAYNRASADGVRTIALNFTGLA